MHRALGLLILAAEGALAQSREPSHWDANVAAAFNVNGCPCNSTAHDCRPDNGATMKQSEMNELKVTYMTEVPLKFAYLTDQDGTILDYHTKGWETGSEEGNLVKFTWDASMQPTRLVPHIVYENSCADVFPSVAVQTWVRQAPPLAPTPPGRSARTHALHARAPMVARAPPPGRPHARAAPYSGHHGGQREWPVRPHNLGPRVAQRILLVPSQRTALALLSEEYDARIPSPRRPSGRAL